MNGKTLAAYLDNPAALGEVSLAELQALVLDYPYSPNLRILLLVKAKLEDNPQYEALLQRAASGTFDRSHLYNLLKELEEAPTAGDVLELKELDSLGLEPLTVPATNSIPSRMNEAFLVPTTLATEEEPSLTDPSETPVENTPPTAVSDGWLDSAAAFLTSLPTPASFQTKPELPQHFLEEEALPAAETTLQHRLRQLRRRQLAHRNDQNSTPNVDRIAYQSVVDNGAVASETLAKLLTRQGQYQHAIKVYRRLLLLNPEKKAIFAPLIKDLKEKL